MKNIKADPEDSLRPEYKRSDFGELIRGKYATTQVDFHQLIEALLACIGEDEGVKFIHHSIGNCIANHKPGDWTYEIDNGNQITLRYWLSEFEYRRGDIKSNLRYDGQQQNRITGCLASRCDGPKNKVGCARGTAIIQAV